MEDLKKQIEAILFSCGRKISIEEIGVLTGQTSPLKIEEALGALKRDHEERQSPLMLIEEGKEWKLTVREGYLDLVRKINPHTELSKTLMETLAVIAWKQPMLQADVIKIRTNKAYEDIKELEEIGFLTRDKHGRSFLLKLSQKFFDYFDLRDAEAARQKFKDFKDDSGDAEQKRMEEFSEDTTELNDDSNDVEVSEQEESVPEEISETPETENSDIEKKEIAQS